MTDSFIVCEKNEKSRKKTTEGRKLTHKLYHIQLYRIHLDKGANRTHNFRSTGTDGKVHVNININTIH